MLRYRLAAVILPALLVAPGPAPAASTPTAAPAARPVATRVLAISIDGLNTDAIAALGKARIPSLTRLLTEGAATLNARTEVEQTVTLPNHAGMLTGRRVDRAKGGHGVTFDLDRPGMTVSKAAGHPVRSVFNVVHRHGGSTAMFATKTKLALYRRSWPKAIDRTVLDTDTDALVDKAIDDLITEDRDFTFLHTSLPDAAGHEHGGMSTLYLDAVEETDGLLGRVLAAIDSHHLPITVVLTVDHGFKAGSTSHSARTDVANYRVPFVVWGAGVTAADLYALNTDDYADPGTKRVRYRKPLQPVRNGDLGNLSLDILALPPIRGSAFDVAQTLDWSAS